MNNLSFEILSCITLRLMLSSTVTFYKPFLKQIVTLDLMKRSGSTRTRLKPFNSVIAVTKIMIQKLKVQILGYLELWGIQF